MGVGRVKLPDASPEMTNLNELKVKFTTLFVNNGACAYQKWKDLFSTNSVNEIKELNRRIGNSLSTILADPNHFGRRINKYNHSRASKKI